MAKKSENKKPAKKAPAKTAIRSADGPESRPGAGPPVSRKSRGLGRGLSSLLGDAGVAAATGTAPGTATGTATGTISGRGTGASQADMQDAQTMPTVGPISGLTELPIEWINSGPWQPRRRFDKDRLTELADSIRAKGLVQPILVRPQEGGGNRYQLIAGERRWRAAQMAQLHVVPAIIREMSDGEAHELALIENIQRADLSAIEEAEGYRQLIDNFGHTQEQLASIIGKSRSHIANLLRLLTLPDSVARLVVEGMLTMGQVRPLIGHPDCEALARHVADKGLSARQVEALVKAGKPDASGKRVAAEKPADILEIERTLSDKLGLAVDFNWDEAKRTGKLVMRFSDLDQFEAVYEKLRKD